MIQTYIFILGYSAILTQNTLSDEPNGMINRIADADTIQFEMSEIQENGIDILYSMVGFAIGSMIPAAIIFHKVEDNYAITNYFLFFYFFGFPAFYSGAYMAITMYIMSALQHEKNMKGEIVGAMPGVILLGIGGALVVIMRNIEYFRRISRDTSHLLDVSYIGPLVSLIAIPVIILGMPVCDSLIE